MKRMITVSLAALLGLTGNFAQAQVQSGVCTSSAECTSTPAPSCDGSTAVTYSSAVCVDSGDTDTTADICEYTPTRTACTSAQRCVRGACVEATRATVALADCGDPSPGQCTGNVAVNYSWEIDSRSGGCAEREAEATCVGHTECSVQGEAALCVDARPRILAEHLPSTLTTEDRQAIERTYTRYADIAENGSGACRAEFMSDSAPNNTVLCNQLAICYSASGVEADQCWTAAAAAGRR